MKHQKCPECGSRDGVRLLVDVTRKWDGESWETCSGSETFECFDCDATDIEPEEVEE